MTPNLVVPACAAFVAAPGWLGEHVRDPPSVHVGRRRFPWNRLRL